jgi:hypothetical protein|tara:strand:- start:331 stop:519 length:189 start_codon:yes stop_codon:yes gene_type:complete
MSLKRIVNDKEVWDAFLEELEDRISANHRSMENLSDTAEIYRHQGAIKALRQLKYLRDYVNG